MKANRLAVAIASLLLCSAPAFAAAPPSSTGSSASAAASENSTPPESTAFTGSAPNSSEQAMNVPIITTGMCQEITRRRSR